MKNWKTTLYGFFGAVLTVVLPLLTGGTVVVKDIAVAGVLAGLGYLAKDAGVTGTDK